MNERQAARLALATQSTAESQRQKNISDIEAMREEFHAMEHAVRLAKNVDKATQRRRRKRCPLPALALLNAHPKLERSRPSPYRGVSWNRRDSLWVARIKIGQKSYFLGTFKPDKVEDAARKYDEAARFHFGGEAKLNFPDRVCTELNSGPRSSTWPAKSF